MFHNLMQGIKILRKFKWVLKNFFYLYKLSV